MAFRIGTTALACLAILKTAGFTNENLPQQINYGSEEDYVTALVTAFDTTNITGAQQADYIQLAIKSVEDGTFHVCPFNINGTKSVTLVLSNEMCEEMVEEKSELISHLTYIKSFIEPVRQNVFNFAQTASSFASETVYTLKDALLAAALSGSGGIGVLIAIYKGSYKVYNYVIKRFLKSHEDTTNNLVAQMKNNPQQSMRAKHNWKIAQTIVPMIRGVKTIKSAKEDNEKNIEMLNAYVESNRTGVINGTLRNSQTEVASNYSEVASNHTEVDSNHTEVDSNHTEVDSNHTEVASNHSGKKRKTSDSEKSTKKIKGGKIKTKKTKTKKTKTKKRKSR